MNQIVLFLSKNLEVHHYMISRRIIRTKALQILYAYYTSETKSLSNVEKELLFSLGKTYDLYHFLMILVIDIADHAEQVMEIKKNKHQPTYEDLNPNTRFINNRLIEMLRQNKQLNSYIQKQKLSWVNHPGLVKELYLFLQETDFYQEYMAGNNHSFMEDRKVIEKLLTNVVLVTEDLHDSLEEMSIYWNDDMEFTVSMVVKTIKKFNSRSDSNQSLMPMFKDQDDSDFARNLLLKTIINHNELRELIKDHSQNWDIDRIAFMDILIMQLAITEFLYFPSIPTKVTLNEYIELSKYYSTEKSRNFINGILDKTLRELRAKKKISKTGRGLIGEEE